MTARELGWLTDAQVAAIAWADDAESTPALAIRLGLPYFTVNHRRRTIRRAGYWGCDLRWDACAVCGAPLAGFASRAPRAAHPACEPARRAAKQRRRRAERAPGALSTPYVRRWRADHPDEHRELRARERARMRERWPELPAEEREASLDHVHEADARDQELTRARANNDGTIWTEAEDRYLIEHPDQSARDAGLALGRTLYAVRSRRVALRKRGLIAEATARGRTTTRTRPTPAARESASPAPAPSTVAGSTPSGPPRSRS